jgi:hypothetical protein
MDFMLRYRGPLSANGSVKQKHAIRKALHHQLERLCQQEPLLFDALLPELPQAVVKGGHLEVPRPLQKMYFVAPLEGFHFVPLIHRPHELACGLDILFLRREKPGDIVRHGGDLDNRLKTLFDALRMPHGSSEILGITPAADNERVYCLLEDDALVTRVSVSTKQLFEPLEVRPVSWTALTASCCGHPSGRRPLR